MGREREKKRNWEFLKGKLPLVWEEREKKVEQSLDAPQICVCVCTNKKILEYGCVWQPWGGERPEKLKAKSRCNQGEI